jgi:hypothetical protein
MGVAFRHAVATFANRHRTPILRFARPQAAHRPGLTVSVMDVATGAPLSAELEVFDWSLPRTKLPAIGHHVIGKAASW